MHFIPVPSPPNGSTTTESPEEIHSTLLPFSEVLCHIEKNCNSAICVDLLYT